MFLVDWWMYDVCYYNTTSTDYPSTTRGTSVGPRVAVNIDFVDIFDFWALDLSELYWYSTPLTTFLVNKLFTSQASVDISTYSEFQWQW